MYRRVLGLGTVCSSKKREKKKKEKENCMHRMFILFVDVR